MFILTPLKNYGAKLQGINQSEREKEKGQAKESHYFGNERLLRIHNCVYLAQL